MELNTKVCVVSGSNTGFGDCVLDIVNIVGAFITPSDFVLTPANIADLQAFLAEKAAAASGRERIYPVHYFEQVESNTEDKVVQTLGYGGKSVVREGDYDWTFQFFQGGICLHKSLRKLNGKGRGVLFYDANGVLFGVKEGENLKAIPLVFFWSDPWAPNDGSAAAVYTAQFVFKPKAINEDLGFVQTDFSLENVKGLQDVALKAAAGSAFPALKIKALTGCAGEDLYDLFADELAAVGAWKATSGGVEVAITSVAKDEALKAWTITIDDTDPNYNSALAFQINLVDPTALAALQVEGFEGKALTVATS